jgi:hypothetical protein
LIDAVFAAGKPKEGGRINGFVALEDGSQAVYQIKSVIEPKPGAGDQEMDRLREYLTTNLGQRQYAAWVDELRKAGDVEVSRGAQD